MTAWVVQYTCPAGRTALIRTMMMLNGSGGNANVTFAVRRGGTIAQLVANPALPNAGFLNGPVTGIVLTPGDELITFFLGANGTSSVYACGSLLNGVAS